MSSQYSPYVGSGPYCYSNSLSMMLGRDSPGTDVIEVLTGAPFGYMLLGGTDPMFSPGGMEPDSGLDSATALLGYECRRRHANDATQAAQWLRQVTPDRPFLAGPLEMGLLRHQPDMTGPIGADHFVVVLGVEGDDVLFHDPHGYPYVTLPIDRFVAAWRADTVGYGTSFTARDTFRRYREMSALEALRAALPVAVKWLRNDDTAGLPPHTAAGSEGLAATAELVAAGSDPRLREHLTRFAIKVGARRLDDAARCLRRLDCHDAAVATLRQARLVGSLQTPMVHNEDEVAADIFARLASHYEPWCQAIEAAVSTLDRA